jgi:predicted aspartyl protease
MGADLMGRVVVEATVENLGDLYLAQKGLAPADDVRRVVIPNALVDTGATTLSMPKSLIDQLGLEKAYEKRSMSSRGIGTVNVYEPVRLAVQGRTCHVDVVELPDEVPTLIGQIPLEFMDWVVDPRGQRLVGNPEHGGEQTIELY